MNNELSAISKTKCLAGFALLLFVFIRQALRNTGQDPKAASKLALLQTSRRKALGR
jgi:hypothetical protein